MRSDSASLRGDDAVDLAHAWVYAITSRHGIRALFIKGPSLHRQALREPRVSSDVDVLVESSRFGDLCDALRAAGWVERPGNFVGTRTARHSKTFVMDGWPCDLDVHGFFPGFLADADEVFETLWARRAHLSFAGRACPVADRTSGALILALHCLRGAPDQYRHAAELEQLRHAPFTPAERYDLTLLARATKSDASLAEVLPRMGVGVDPGAVSNVDAATLRSWRARVDADARGPYIWVSALRRAGWRERPLIIWRAVWPSDRDLLLTRPEIPDQYWAKLRGRVARLGRGIRGLPKTARALRRYHGLR